MSTEEVHKPEPGDIYLNIEFPNINPWPCIVYFDGEDFKNKVMIVYVGDKTFSTGHSLGWEVEHLQNPERFKYLCNFNGQEFEKLIKEHFVKGSFDK